MGTARKGGLSLSSGLPVISAGLKGAAEQVDAEIEQLPSVIGGFVGRRRLVLAESDIAEF
ncbi:hypothetical protein [Streptomyces canus]|uniref:hypothetical protein n=1 Tax=Streptomyces canus TaxID=58343 RepID=UPI0036EC9464